MTTIKNGQELVDWLYYDRAIDFYEDEIILGYAAGCAHCGGYEMEDDNELSAYAEGAGITLDECNGVDDLDYKTREEYDNTIEPLQKFAEEHIEECTQHINDKTIHKYLKDNVTIGENGSDDYFEFILNRIDSLI